MKRFTTIICSVLFMLAGYFVASREPSHSNMIYAADYSPPPVKIGVNDLPLDLQLDLTRTDTVRDTVTIIHHDTVQVVKYKTKYRTHKPSVEPDTLLAQPKDTLYVPSLKVKMQMGEKELMDTIITLGPAICNNR